MGLTVHYRYLFKLFYRSRNLCQFVTQATSPITERRVGDSDPMGHFMIRHNPGQPARRGMVRHNWGAGIGDRGSEIGGQGPGAGGFGLATVH